MVVVAIYGVAFSGPPFFSQNGCGGSGFNPVRKKGTKDLMAQNSTQAAIAALALPLVEAAGLELWGLELLGEGRPILRVYVEGPSSGATIEDCARLSRQLGLALDVEDIIPSAYTLEVSSPGLTRPFFSPEQLTAYVGRTLDVTLSEALPEFPRRKKFHGRLEEVSGDTFALLPDDATDPDASSIQINWDNVRKAQLVHIFPQKGKGAAPKATAPQSPKLEEEHQ